MFAAPRESSFGCNRTFCRRSPRAVRIPARTMQDRTSSFPSVTGALGSSELFPE